MRRRSLLNGQTEDAHDAVHGLVLPSHGAAAIRRVIPEARAGRVQAGAVFLHNHTGHNIFKGFVEFRQLIETLLNNVGCPRVHF